MCEVAGFISPASRALERLSTSFLNFTASKGKMMSANPSKSPWLDSRINRPKTGFSIDMTQWLFNANNHIAEGNLSKLTILKIQWVRSWSKLVDERVVVCE